MIQTIKLLLAPKLYGFWLGEDLDLHYGFYFVMHRPFMSVEGSGGQTNMDTISNMVNLILILHWLNHVTHLYVLYATGNIWLVSSRCLTAATILSVDSCQKYFFCFTRCTIQSSGTPNFAVSIVKWNRNIESNYLSMISDPITSFCWCDGFRNTTKPWLAHVGARASLSCTEVSVETSASHQREPVVHRKRSTNHESCLWTQTQKQIIWCVLVKCTKRTTI